MGSPPTPEAMHRWYIKKRASKDISWEYKRYLARVKARQHKSNLVAYFKNKPCADCQMCYPSYVMTFDHKNPADKSFTIGDHMDYSNIRIVKEIKKCAVVCFNCHAERTHNLMKQRKNHFLSFKFQALQ